MIVTIKVEAEVLYEQGESTVVRIKNGFGDPEVRLHKNAFEIVTQTVTP